MQVGDAFDGLPHHAEVSGDIRVTMGGLPITGVDEEGRREGNRFCSVLGIRGDVTPFFLCKPTSSITKINDADLRAACLGGRAHDCPQKRRVGNGEDAAESDRQQVTEGLGAHVAPFYCLAHARNRYGVDKRQREL